ncbi:gibberellin 2-oxidase, partial [Striga asiatica]
EGTHHHLHSPKQPQSSLSLYLLKKKKMVLASPNPLKIEKIRDDIELPIIDLHWDRTRAAVQIVRACEEFGFFKVINHGVPQEIISRMDREAHEFFSRPGPDKQRAGPANPYGYGLKNIGLNGDIGELEYLLLQANAPYISDKSKYISTDPENFRCFGARASQEFISIYVNHDPPLINQLYFRWRQLQREHRPPDGRAHTARYGAAIGYVAAVKGLACEILDMIGEVLSGAAHPTASVFSRLISDAQSDSLFRLNHYLPTCHPKIGFGEHTDPQILTLLRSNGVGGLQVSTEDGVWVPVSPYPELAFCVNVGDVLQVGPTRL